MMALPRPCDQTSTVETTWKGVGRQGERMEEEEDPRLETDAAPRPEMAEESWNDADGVDASGEALDWKGETEEDAVVDQELEDLECEGCLQRPRP